ncbi:MAG: preprotein translocase subunit YajC [Oscillibacter sp.]|nr:preprotein translocase subunit YajC [Oscillibacter sp.]
MVMLLILVAMMAFIYFRENKQKKKAQAVWDSLKKGDTITSIGGIVGKIVAVNEQTIIIETSEDRVRMELLKTAVNTSAMTNNADTKKKADKEEKKEEKEALPEATEKAEK